MNHLHDQPTYDDVLKAYVEGLLSREEIQQFEQEMSVNQPLQEACSAYILRWNQVAEELPLLPPTARPGWHERVFYFITVWKDRHTLAIRPASEGPLIKRKYIWFWLALYLGCLLLLYLLSHYL